VTDVIGHKDRPGAGPHCMEMLVDGTATNCYLNYNPESARVEIVQIMPRGTPDKLLRDFPDDESAWSWARTEVYARRLP